ncbi:MAG: B12-binding domain-containing radical SAM protein [Deltaproteobacteria bacterium]|nr:B12-binding domain-containing radical SAM protein [Deltaproteobacteria bacterium]
MEPLPAAYLAGLTPRDVQITFFDDRMEPIDFDHPADLVAVSVETYTAKRSYQIASEYRRRGVPVVMGGFHPTLLPEEALQYAEAIVIGEAENLWPELIDDFRQGGLKRIYKSSQRPDITAAMPDRTVFGSRNYFPIGIMDAGRGCTYKCDFCAIQAYFQATHNWRGIEALVDEVKRVKAQHKLIFFIDDNLMARPEQAKQFFEALIPLKIKWISQADITTTYDAEMLTLMKKSGCQGILIGFESLNRENLKSMNKGFNAARGGAAEAVRMLHRHGLRLYATFLFGYDADTVDSFGEALDFCIEHNIFITAFNHITPFPGTPLYKRLESEKRLLYDKWWLDDRYQYGDVPFRTIMPADEIRENCRQARAAFYSMRSIAKRLVNATNRNSPAVFAAYMFINMILRNDVSQRYSLPLGDSAYAGELLKVDEAVRAAF